MLTPAEHARADAFEMWLKADYEPSEQVQLSLDLSLSVSVRVGTMEPRKEWGRAAQTADPASTPTLDRSSYA